LKPTTRFNARNDFFAEKSVADFFLQISAGSRAVAGAPATTNTMIRCSESMTQRGCYVISCTGMLLQPPEENKAGPCLPQSWVPM